MKKTALIAMSILTIVLFSLTTASAETSMSAGVKVGFNMANLTGKAVDDAKTAGFTFSALNGICAGGFFDYSFGMIAIQPEVLFSQKGANYKGTMSGMSFTGSENLSYLEIPVLVKYDIPLKGNVKPNIFVGPAIGIKMSATSKATAGGSSSSSTDSTIKSTDMGFAGGVGADFTMSNGSAITLDVRYVMGLGTIITTSGADEMKNTVISVIVGYAFPLGGGSKTSSKGKY